MTEQLAERFAELPVFLGGHMLLSLAALALGLAISLPLGIIASRRPRLSEITLGVAGIIQTVPSLALLALMVPILGGMIGFLPAFVALTLYSILPILANTVIGIRGIDPAMKEAAQGLGMSPIQMLRHVELPLAAPVIIAGIRTATVLVVGTATLATPVGETTLGNYIFQGLETRNHTATIFGCVFAALLALVMDQLVRLLEVAARRRSPRLAWTGAAGLLLVLAGGLYAPLAHVLAARANVVIVGSGPFTEQHVLSEVLANQLLASGFTIDQRKGMGESIQFEALRRGKIDCTVDYSGSIWSIIMKRTEVADPETTLKEAGKYLIANYGIVCLGSLGFEDAYALAMRRSHAERLGIKTVADLARYSARMKIGGDHQFFGRPEWINVRDSYGLKFSRQVAMDPTLMYAAVAKESVDVISAYTSDGRILAYDLVILGDPKQAFPPYDAILLLSPQAAARPDFVEALRPLVGAISPNAMRQANMRVDVDNQSPQQAARQLFDQFQQHQ